METSETVTGEPISDVTDSTSLSILSCSGCVKVQSRVRGINVNFLVDTGACVNILSHAIVELLNPQPSFSETNLNLVGISGTLMSCKGVIRDLVISVGGVDLSAEFYVAEIEEPGILGQPFLSAHGCLIDFDKNLLRIDSRLPVTVPLCDPVSKPSPLIARVQSDSVVSSCNPEIHCVVDLPVMKVKFPDQLYFLTFDDILEPLITTGSLNSNFPVRTENGHFTIPIHFDCDAIDLSFPQGMILGKLIPATYCFTTQESTSSPTYVDDFDPSRVAEIVSLLKLRDNPLLQGGQCDAAVSLITEFADVFALGRHELGRTSLVEHEIHLTSNKPVRLPYRKVPLHLREHCITELEDLLAAGLIEHSESNYNIPAMILRKNDKTRLILDLRALNAITERSYATVPALATMTAGCSGSRLFSSLDIKDGFLQVPLKQEHRKFTAFAIPGIGYFQWTVMALGLCGAPGTFQNLLDRVLAGLPPSVCSAFIDDILCPAKDVEEAIDNLRVVLGRIKVSGLRLSPKKCLLFRDRIKYCGVFLSEEGISVDKEKVEAIRNMNLPRSLKDVRRLLGCYGWFRNHIPDFADKAKGLTDCLKQVDRFELTEEAIKSVRVLGESLCSPPVLMYPDRNLEFHVFTDASLYAVGGCLMHQIDGEYRPVAYSSKLLSPAERKWASYKREFFALWFHVTKQWRWYLLGGKFRAYVDAKPITQSGFQKHCTQAVMTRWIMDLSDYDFELLYRPGPNMEVADCLSRLPTTSDELYPWWSSQDKDKTRPAEDKDKTRPAEDKDKTRPAEDKDKTRPLPEHDKTHTLLRTQVTFSDSVTEINDEVPPTVPDGSFENPLPAYYSGALMESQSSDPDLMTARKWLEENKRPTDSLETSQFSDTLLKIWMLFPHLCVSREGLICYKYFMHNSGKYRELIYVPRSYREELLKSHHDTPSAGHLGPKKTLLRLREKYFFESMTTAVKLYCQTCYVCFPHNQIYKKNPAAPLKPFVAVRPNQTLCIDLVGPIRGGQFLWIFTMVDKMTKLVQAKPLRNAESGTIARCLLKSWVWIYGVPEQILSDRGANLHSSHIITELYKLLGIAKIATTAYRPSTNGTCEGYNKHAVTVIKKLVADKPSQWHNKLEECVFALNSAVNESTKFSPHQLCFGRELRNPMDLVHDTTSTAYYASAAHLASRQYQEIRDMYELVRVSAVSSVQRQKLQYDKKRGFHTDYDVGDLVLVWRPIPPTVTNYRKFYNKFSGPWKIQKILSQWTYEVLNLSTNKVIVTHFDTLRKIPDNMRGIPTAAAEPLIKRPDSITTDTVDTDDDHYALDFIFNLEPVTENNAREESRIQEEQREENVADTSSTTATGLESHESSDAITEIQPDESIVDDPAPEQPTHREPYNLRERPARRRQC
eukprot:sb/3460972/